MTRQLCSVALCIAVIAATSLAAHATILPFVITPTPAANSSFETTFADYGDNVNSTSVVSGPNTYSYLQGYAFTPNIALTYSHTGLAGNLGPVTYALGPWAGGVCYLYAFTGSRHFITFTPTNSDFGVKLNSFEFNLYDGPYPVNEITWTVHKDTTVGAVLLSANETGWSTGENRTINLGGVTYFGTTVLEIFLKDVVGGGNVAIDNLDFDQIKVPEPSTASLLGLGLCGLVVRTRRRRATT